MPVQLQCQFADQHPPAVGGIYSVLKSKAPVTTAEYGDRYTLIGPLNHHSVRALPE